MRTRSPLGLGTLVAGLLLATAIVPIHASRLGEIRPLFRIERSKNANVVQYDARVTADGRLDEKEPVRAYWIKDDGRTKELKWVERRLAYGFEIELDGERREATLRMAADIGRLIAVRSGAAGVRAETRIDGYDAVIERVYVSSIETGLLPQVEYIDLHGRDVQSGEPRFERLTP